MKRLSASSGVVGLAFVASFILSGCASMSKTQEGAAVGGAAGAVLGGIIGNQTGSTARGAILGAAIGGAAGAYIGDYMDDQAEEIERDLEGATVERVGEGIKITFDSGILFDTDSAVVQPAGLGLRPRVDDPLHHDGSRRLVGLASGWMAGAARAVGALRGAVGAQCSVDATLFRPAAPPVRLRRRPRR